MFRPIKNFITYIQKNAGNSAIFGGTTPAEVGEELPDAATLKTADQNDGLQLNEMEMKMNPSTIIDTILFETDLEQHIKSCVIPLKNGRIVSTHDHNHNNHEDPIESESVSCDMGAPQALADKCSIHSNKGTEDTTTEVDNGTSLSEIPHEDAAAQFPGPEIVVINDDLNSSLTSETPSEDPLAIDEFVSTGPDTVSLLDAAANEDWIKIELLKANESANALPKDEPQVSAEEQCVEVPRADGANEGNEHPSNEEAGEELRGDGSDSGLGSEMSTLQTTLNHLSHNSLSETSESTPIVCTAASTTTTSTTTAMSRPALHKQSSSSCPMPASTSALVPCPTSTSELLSKKPLRSNLKRRLDDSLDSPTDGDSGSCSIIGNELATQQKKPKRSINFDSVQVFYFPRQQGFGCVPSAGGCTLGMGAQHVSSKTLTLAEHAAEIRRAHRLQLQEINPRGSSSEDTEESEEDYLSEGSGSDLDTDMNGFLQPVSPKQRRALLKAAGVRKIDANEKAECRDIRNSREVCGCTCRDFCDPDTCSCSLAGIKCQVDRAMFPCGCSRDACGNTVGRVEFNPTRVRTHYIHTIMRLEMENRQQQSPLCTNSSSTISYSSSAAIASSPAPAHHTSPHILTTATATANFYSLQTQTQTQSNYSSGYNSPAYGCETGVGYFQQQGAGHGHYATPDLSASTQYPIPIENVDTNLFNGSPTTTPAYGDLMPSYTSSSTAYHNVSYTSMNGNLQTQISTYSSFNHQTASTSYLNPNPSNHSGLPATYSSCAVPSVPPFGAATTTAATLTAQYLSPALDSSANSNCALDTDASSSSTSFISLNTPISSSSRLSQINDLLQHNRNTTAALVAVVQSADNIVLTRTADAMLATSDTTAAAKATTESITINTPPIQEVQECLDFAQPPASPLTLTTIGTATDKIRFSKQLPSAPPPEVQVENASVTSTSITCSSGPTNEPIGSAEGGHN